jgi:glycosyl transferase family 25
MHIFVINLKGSTERRRHMEDALGALKLPFEIIEAVDGRAFDPDNLPHYNGILRRLTAGQDLMKEEIGCILSHRKIYQRMIDDNIPCAVILEDDAILSEDFPDILQKLNNLTVKWDMIRFLGRPKCEQQNRTVMPIDTKYYLTRVIKPFGGAYTYMLTKTAAQKLLQMSEKNWMPIDTLHGQSWRTKFAIFSVTPSPACADNVIASTIDDTRWKKNNQLSGWEKTVYPLTRFLYKLYVMFCNTYMRLKTWPIDAALRKSSAK